ncbi:MAG: hypothetical protein C4330_09230 [Chitinophagaceae bacterium]
MANIDMEKLRKEMELNKVDMSKLQEEMKELRPKIEKSMKEAKESLGKAKAELKEYKSFINDLEKDGLLDTKNEYTIKNENGLLYINGKKQSDEVYRKHQSFLEKHKNIVIEKNENGFNIHNNK